MPTPHEVILAWIDAFNRRDADSAATLYAVDAINHQVAAGPPAIGLDAIHDDLVGFFSAFPDSYTKLETIIVDGDRVAIEWLGGNVDGRFSRSSRQRPHLRTSRQWLFQSR